MAIYRTFCLTVAAATLLAACAVIPRNETDSRLAYQAAIGDAAVASPNKIFPLRALPAGTTVSVVSWMSAAPCSGQTLPCDWTIANAPLWVTLDGEVQSACRTWNLRGDGLRRRLEQLLGMPMDPPPQFRKTTFVVLNVARENIRRPCLGIDETNPAQPTCTLDVRPTTPEEIRTFVGRQMADSYVVDNPKAPGYPFTRLGYTYDWGPTAKAGHYGASEFIIVPGSNAQVNTVISTADYCAGPTND